MWYLDLCFFLLTLHDDWRLLIRFGCESTILNVCDDVIVLFPCQKTVTNVEFPHDLPPTSRTGRVEMFNVRNCFLTLCLPFGPKCLKVIANAQLLASRQSKDKCQRGSN